MESVLATAKKGSMTTYVWLHVGTTKLNMPQITRCPCSTGYSDPRATEYRIMLFFQLHRRRRLLYLLKIIGGRLCQVFQAGLHKNSLLPL